ncbi:DUF6973 domain-containing protein [Persicirhabdus sediminis]|uniref:DUF6973 domain-containing protein n=1 Tax=Persicirhabdus sediminis TaxID=454144 RepID=A0A8J7SIC3_9BACT|nr:hypothetical protein [Persicirhabdus sediminis]MBK1790484.1 hypothetical protein [Persicirhabdus sediminis]
MNLPRLKKLSKKAIIIAIPVWLVIWLTASWLAPKVCNKILPKVQAKTQSMGVKIDHIEFANIKVAPWLTQVTIESIKMNFDTIPGDKHHLKSTFKCDSVVVSLHNPFTLRGSVKASDFDIQFHQSDLPKDIPFDRFTKGQVYLANVPIVQPKEAAKEILTGVTELFNTNSGTGDFRFSGEVVMRAGDNEIPAKLYTEHDGDQYRLRFSEDDVRAIAKALKVDLAAEQIKLVSVYPLRMPVIMLITDKAEKLSKRYQPRDKWKQDALRHTSWSFMLTETFGPDFAKYVTDAQETKPNNEKFERLMDYNNNAVGRKLFAENTKLQQIPNLLATDQRIVLSPDDAKSRPADSLLR